MNKPWSFIKAFENKSFEQNSKNTNNSAPIQVQTVVPIQVEVVQPKIMSANCNEKAAEDIFPPKSILPLVQPVVELMLPVEKKPKKTKRRKR